MIIYIYLNHIIVNYNFGGNDQWPNILAGVELVNKLEDKKVYAMAIKLLLKKDGTKMGKTAGGALWLDKEKLSVYDFYQYFINIDDKEVEDVLKSLTFLSNDKIEELLQLEGKEINEAKKIAAYEITRIVHGKEEADKAKELSENVFEKDIMADGMPEADANIGEDIINICIKIGFGNSRSEIKKLIKQRGLSLNDRIIDNLNRKLEKEDEVDGKGYIILRKGKKIYYKINIKKQ